MITFMLIINSIFLGIGLAMDAFSVSLANGLNEPKMKTGRMCGMAGIYAFFQFAMPVIGWVCVHTIAEKFEAFQVYIPWIALILLLYIGGKMILESIKESREKKESEETENKSEANEENINEAKAVKAVGFGTLIVQGIATSIDALSVGFTISDYNTVEAFTAGIIIAVVTFVICMIGIVLGKKFGTKFAGKAGIFGGIILIAIGVEIFVTGVFNI